jgi:hypothetical protein
MEKSLPEEPEMRGKQILLKWKTDIDLQTIYVNQAAITSTGNEYYLVFGETDLPVVFGKNFLPEEILINPKVRLVIGLGAMKAIVELILKNVEKNLEDKE